MAKIFGVVFWAIIGIIQVLPQYFNEKTITTTNPSTPYYSLLEWFVSYKFLISATTAAITSASGFCRSLVKRSRKESKAWMEHREEVLRLACEDLFGDKQNFRITLFRDIPTRKALWRYLTNIPTGRIDFHRDFPVFREKYIRYIEIWQRYGSEYKNSKTFFICRMNTVTECEGVAAMVRQTTTAKQITNLPDIQNIDISQWTEKDLLDPSPTINPTELGKIKKYMKSGHISRLATLKAIHVKARAIYGELLYNKDGKPFGVIVIDSLKEPEPFENIISKISVYAQIIGGTL